LTICTNVHTMTMNYQWDREKAGQNFRKHGIHFADAVSVFSDDFAVTIEVEGYAEARWIRMGLDHFGRILVVVYTWRDSEVRLISARKAMPGERKQYTGIK